MKKENVLIPFNYLLLICLSSYLLQVRGLFRPVPYLAFPLTVIVSRGTGPKPDTPFAAEGNIY